MSSARKQLEELYYDAGHEISDGEYPAYGDGSTEESRKKWIDAVLAVVKGLPAMQEEELAHADCTDDYACPWDKQVNHDNAFRRVIMAELEGRDE